MTAFATNGTRDLGKRIAGNVTPTPAQTSPDKSRTGAAIALTPSRASPLLYTQPRARIRAHSFFRGIEIQNCLGGELPGMAFADQPFRVGFVHVRHEQLADAAKVAGFPRPFGVIDAERVRALRRRHTDELVAFEHAQDRRSLGLPAELAQNPPGD